MDIAVIGTGYVGLVAATCFSGAGHHVVCVDSNQEKLRLLRQGKAPFFEPGLDELLRENIDRMDFVDTVQEAAIRCAVIFVAVGTPEQPDGSASLEDTFRVLQQICAAATQPLYVVLKSTVPIGTAERANAYCREHCKHDIEIISNPEFLRQGSALHDFFHPDRVVIGCRTLRAREFFKDLYGAFVKDREQILFMDNTSAEMVKYAANSFLALKISFINELALLAGKLGADIDQVKAGFTSDNRINPAFFNAGIGYGGSCFPKDVHALIYTGKQVGIDLRMLKAADDVNERQKSILTDRLYKRFGRIEGRKIAVWGLSFKPSTDDVRRAPSIKIIEDLVRMGARVTAYDPIAIKNAKSACLAQFTDEDSPLAAAADADAVLIVTDWPEFKQVNLDSLKTAMRHPVILDGRNLFSPVSMAQAGFEYYSIGRQTALPKQHEKKSDNPLTTTAWI